MANTTKARNWAFIVYPESMPKDWLDILQMTGLPFAISPLHAEDLDPTGEQKKPHYHVLTYYDGPVTQACVKKVTDSVNGTIPIKLESLKGMYRYHIHKDNPEKHQYLDKDRIFLNGFDVKKVDDLSYYEVKALLHELYDIVCDNHIFEYSDLIDILRKSELYNELDVAENHTLTLNTYIRSKRYKHEDEVKKLLTTSHN